MSTSINQYRTISEERVKSRWCFIWTVLLNLTCSWTYAIGWNDLPEHTHYRSSHDTWDIFALQNIIVIVTIGGEHIWEFSFFFGFCIVLWSLDRSLPVIVSRQIASFRNVFSPFAFNALHDIKWPLHLYAYVSFENGLEFDSWVNLTEHYYSWMRLKGWLQY